MSLQIRLSALITAIGADIKALRTRVNTVDLIALTAAAAPAAASAAVNAECFSAAKPTRIKLDLSGFTQVRLTALPIALGNSATAAIKLQYQTGVDAATWTGTDAGVSCVLGNGTAGLVHDSGWLPLAAGARVDNVTVACVVGAAFGTTAPTVGSIRATFR